MCLGEQTAPSIYFLRKAWYVFSRLVDIPFEECFICPTCGPSPNVIVCDGTMVGMRKDLLPFKHKNQPQENPVFPVIKGSAHVDRVLIKSKRARDMLLKYSGYRRDRKPIACPQMVTIKKSNPKQPAVNKVCGPQKGYGEKRCEIQGGGQ